jgi:hypothetical protein
MINHLAGAAASCSTGTWSQKWKCSWNEPATSAAHAGYTFGHSVVPALVVLAVVILVVRAVRKRKARSSPAPAGTRARAGAGRW